MYDYNLEIFKSTKKREEILTTAVIATIFAFLYCIYEFVYFVKYMFIPRPGFLYALLPLLSIVLTAAPLFLFIVYVMYGHKYEKLTYMLPVAFIIMAIQFLLDSLNFHSISSIFTLISFIAFAFATYSALTGFSHKKILSTALIIAICAMVADVVLCIINFFKFKYFSVFSLIPIISNVIFTVAILLLVLNNDITSIIKNKNKEDSINNL